MGGTCKGGKKITDYCYRNVSFVYTKERTDILVDKEFDIVGRNKLKIICATCKKPPILHSAYIQFCGLCERYYRGSPDSESCEECMDVV